jgi:hypothetical protein
MVEISTEVISGMTIEVILGEIGIVREEILVGRDYRMAGEMILVHVASSRGLRQKG